MEFKIQCTVPIHYKGHEVPQTHVFYNDRLLQ
jgi:hypothetical protein